MADKSFYIAGIQFGSLVEYVSIRKIHTGFTVEDHVVQSKMINSEHATPEKEIRSVWEIVAPMTWEKAKERYFNNPYKLKLIKNLLNGKITWGDSNSSGLEVLDEPDEEIELILLNKKTPKHKHKRVDNSLEEIKDLINRRFDLLSKQLKSIKGDK